MRANPTTASVWLDYDRQSVFLWGNRSALMLWASFRLPSALTTKVGVRRDFPKTGSLVMPLGVPNRVTPESN